MTTMTIHIFMGLIGSKKQVTNAQQPDDVTLFIMVLADWMYFSNSKKKISTMWEILKRKWKSWWMIKRRKK